jgi:hypothetical protein
VSPILSPPPVEKEFGQIKYLTSAKIGFPFVSFTCYVKANGKYVVKAKRSKERMVSDVGFMGFQGDINVSLL